MPHEPTLDASLRSAVVEALLSTLSDHYVFPELAEAMATAIRTRLANGVYDTIDDPATFRDVLTQHLRAVCHDKHLRLVHYIEPQPPRDTDLYADPNALATYWTEAALDNYGFHEAKRLAGNVGYLCIRGLDEAEETAETITAAMTFLARTSALIIDIRHHSGGAPTGVAFLCSYFFDTTPVHLNDIYCRNGDTIQQFWTLPHIPGKRYLNKPLYILTSRRTPSAGEELAYDLQMLKRATIVGETTVGAANPVAVYQIHPHFDVRVPTCRAINPHSGTNWEGTGVHPDIAVPEEQALHVAHRAALQHILDQLGERPAGPMRTLWDEARAALATLEQGNTSH